MPCRNETASYLAHVLGVDEKDDEVRSLMERMTAMEAQQFDHSGAPRPSSWSEMYALAGGDPATLAGPRSAPIVHVERAEANKLKAERQFVPKLESRRSQAMKSFWDAQAASVYEAFACALEAGDFDAAGGLVPPSKNTTITPELFRSARLDEHPLTAGVDRALLRRAAVADVLARDLAVEALKIVEPDALDPDAFKRNRQRIPAYAASEGVACRRLDTALQGGSAELVDAILAPYFEQPRSQLAAKLYEQAHPLMQASSLAESWTATGIRLAGQLELADEPRVSALVRPVLLARLADVHVPSHPVVCQLLELDGGRSATHEAICDALAAGMDTEDPAALSDLVASIEALVERGDSPAVERARQIGVDLLVKVLSLGGKTKQLMATCERLLRLDETNAGQQAVATWFVESAASESGGRADAATLGEWLLQHLSDTGGGHDRVKRATLAHLNRALTADTNPLDGADNVDKLLRLGVGGSDAADAVLAWFQTWRAASADRADLGESLVSTVPQTHVEQARALARAALEHLLSEVTGGAARIGVLARLTDLCPDVEDFATELKQIRGQALVRKVALAAGIGFAAVVLAWVAL